MALVLETRAAATSSAYPPSSEAEAASLLATRCTCVLPLEPDDVAFACKSPTCSSRSSCPGKLAHRAAVM